MVLEAINMIPICDYMIAIGMNPDFGALIKQGIDRGTSLREKIIV